MSLITLFEQNKRKRGKHSRIAKIPGGYTYTLYSTTIALVREDYILLATNGYRTATTKAHINMILGWLNLPVRMYSNKGEWYMYEEGMCLVPFREGITIDNDGNIG